MSRPALVLAVLLHVAVVLALWWMHLDDMKVELGETPIEVTIAEPPPPPPPPDPPAEPLPSPPAPPVLSMPQGLAPPADITSDRPTQVPPTQAPSQATPAPPPPMEAPKPRELPQPAAPPPPAAAAPAPPPVAPPAAPVPQRPQQQAHATPQPPPQAPRPERQPSPLSTAPPSRPPAAPADPKDAPSPHPFVNPADTYNRARVSDNYLWQVVRKLHNYRYQANVDATQGLTVVRVVIARDGRLLDAQIAQSSGVPEFDRGVLAGVRQGSPYTPLPPDIQGASATFTLPLVSTRRQ
jgi:protein TonB